MLNKVSLFTLLILFAFINAVSAHTHVKSTSPQNGEVIKEQLKEITITFEGKIEEGSTFTVKNANGQSVEVNNITVNENIIKGQLSNPLENGEYKVDWIAISEDGHQMEESFSFAVDAPVTDTKEENDKDNEVTTQTNATENNVDQQNSSVNSESEQNEENSFILPVIIGILFLIFIIGFVLISKRKK